MSSGGTPGEETHVKIFLVVLAIAGVLGGLVGGEITGNSFSFIGLAVGIVATAAVLLGLGAYFHHSDERRRVTDQAARESLATRRPAMTPRRQAAGDTGERPATVEAAYLAKIHAILAPQVTGSIRTLFGTVMTDERIAGYVFGAHDAVVQRVMKVTASNQGMAKVLILASYRDLFGEQAGNAAMTRSLGLQDSPHFEAGRALGGREAALQIDDGAVSSGLEGLLRPDAKPSPTANPAPTSEPDEDAWQELTASELHYGDPPEAMRFAVGSFVRGTRTEADWQAPWGSLMPDTIYPVSQGEFTRIATTYARAVKSIMQERFENDVASPCRAPFETTIFNLGRPDDDDVSLVLAYDGTRRSGTGRMLARVDGKTLPLTGHLRRPATLGGAASSFLIFWYSRCICAIDHGFYHAPMPLCLRGDRAAAGELSRELVDQDRDHQAFLRLAAGDAALSCHLRRRGDDVEVAACGWMPNTGVVEFSIRQRSDGTLVDATQRVIVPTTTRTFF